MTVKDMNNRNTDTRRADTIKGLRLLADLLETTDLPVPTHLDAKWLIFTGFGGEGIDETTLADQKATAAAIVRNLGGADKRELGDLFTYTRTLGGPEGIKVEVAVDRPAVCERVVTGTREVERRVPVGEDTRPYETVTETVEDVTWECRPLLAD